MNTRISNSQRILVQICNQLWRIISFVFLFCTILPYSTLAQVPDYEREDRLAEEAEFSLFDGDPVYLNDGSRDFLALFTEFSDSASKTAFVIFHGRGFHPDWRQVVGPLRERFTEEGITTLSLQMPVLAKGAKYYEYLEILPYAFPRIEAGIRYLRSMGFEWIAFIAHSCSVHMTMAWIRERGDLDINAYIGIGMGATDYKQPMLEPFPLDVMTVPILDVYGSEDYPAVTEGAKDRKIAIESAGSIGSRQIAILGSDHFFEGYEDDLANEILNWFYSLSTTN